MAFSNADDEDLARFLALRIPYKENGGRTGNNVYKELVAEVRLTQKPLDIFICSYLYTGKQTSLSMGSATYLAIVERALQEKTGFL